MNVLILGAGVSASCGIALAKDIFSKSMAKLLAEEPVKAERVKQLLEYFYRDFEKLHPQYPNIEDFLNILETANIFNSQEFKASTLWPKEKIAVVKDIVLRAVTDYVSGFKTDNDQTAYVDKFIGNVPDGTVVITFNWDLTVESALTKTSTPRRVRYSYSANNHAKSLTLLKPHGSTNWFPKKTIA